MVAERGIVFDDLAEVYEELIDWPKRLAHEAPFFRRWFKHAGVGSVVDVACGTGRHAAMFHDWGLRVEGADLSPRMIERARANFGAPAGLRWVVRSFEGPVEPPDSFDAAVCLGNSLALAPDAAAVERAIRQMFAAVRSGGLVVVHVLNLWQLPEGPCVWQKSKHGTLPLGEVLIVKGVHRSGRQGYVELVVAPLDEPARLRTESVPFLGLEAPDLERTARTSGATALHFFGGYQKQPYDPAQSVDLVMVAEKV